MLPVTHGALETRRRSLVYTAATVVTSLLIFLTGDVSYVYLVITALSGAAFLWLAWRQLREASVPAAMQLFHFSLLYVAIVFMAMVADRLVL